jgi:hypothetical protein
MVLEGLIFLKQSNVTQNHKLVNASISPSRSP